MCTAYLYQAWMHKPSVVSERLDLNLLLNDLVSGMVVIACVILSFLSLISFADFLREEWQQNGLVQGGERRRNRQFDRGEDEPRRFPVREQDIDNGLWQNVQQEILAQPAPLRAGLAGMNENDDAMHLEDRHADLPDGHGENNDSENDSEHDDSSDSEYEEGTDPLDDANDLADEDEDEDEEWMLDPIERDDMIENDVEPRRDVRPGPPNNPIPPPPFADDPEDPVDVGINIALDEILGIRGPLSTVVQNLMWLLAFNAVYLGFFTFAPRVIGISFLSLFFNNITAPVEIDENSTFVFNATTNLTLTGVFKAVEYESTRLNTAFRIRDVLTIIGGYMCGALVTILIRGLWVWAKKLRTLYTGRRGREAEIEDFRAAFEDMNRFAQAFGHDNPQMDDPQVFALGMAFGIALDALMAITKVGLLLFMKMFLLPIVLGIALDASTVSLLGGSIEDRVLYAGKDLFSSLLLHWVAGITFMLLVTVSVLQLREVMHPDLLAQVIRPQEPQPDLLGNLLHETAGTHAKRMLLSLVIYSFLLYIQIHFPVGFLMSVGGRSILSFFQLKFCYIIMPQLQVPLELLVFHLCMLALLERNKNSIGELQHHWLKFLSNQFGLTGALLPREVDSFRLVGSKAVYVEDHAIDEFWLRLSATDLTELCGEQMLIDHLDAFRAPLTSCSNPGHSKENGERVLRFGSGLIRLPKRLPGRANRSRSVLLPTKFGRYRLKRDLFNNMDPVIQLWEEVPGLTIARPPEGWDDLGAGGADVQGRWAWGKEKKSVTERGVSRRTKLFYKHQGIIEVLQVVTKLISVLFLSWVATIAFLATVLGGPLAIGRFLYAALRVPDAWTHDPLGFGIGSLIFFPIAKRCSNYLYTADTTFVQSISSWICRFHPPPLAKVSVVLLTLVSWFGVAPFLLGFVYELTFVKDSDWFTGDQALVDNWMACWALGCLLLNTWGYCCASGFLTRAFWRGIFDNRADAQDGDAGAEHDERAAAWISSGDNRVRLQWQGKYGRANNYYECLWRVACHWEWEKVDSTALLSHFALPVVVELAWIVLGPQACLLLCVWRFPGMSGLARLVLLRSLLGLALVYEILSAFRGGISAWFAAAHKTARDEKYLIGKVLLNYEETTGKS